MNKSFNQITETARPAVYYNNGNLHHGYLFLLLVAQTVLLMAGALQYVYFFNEDISKNAIILPDTIHLLTVCNLFAAAVAPYLLIYFQSDRLKSLKNALYLMLMAGITSFFMMGDLLYKLYLQDSLAGSASGFGLMLITFSLLLFTFIHSVFLLAILNKTLACTADIPKTLLFFTNSNNKLFLVQIKAYTYYLGVVWVMFYLMVSFLR